MNNPNYLQAQVLILEKYVDGELTKDENIIKFINSHPSGYDSSSGFYTDGTVATTQYTPIYAVHKDPDVKSRSNMKSGNFTIWTNDSDDLLLDGNLVNTTPWLDKTTDNKILGHVTIQLPEKTNKNVALLLAEKYKSTQIASNGFPAGGFWSYVVLPEKPENASSSGIVYPDAVTVEQQGDTLYMTFRLYPM